MATPSAKSAPGSLRCVAPWGYSLKPAWRLRQQVQGGEQPRQELYPGEDGASHGADRGQCRPLSAATRHRGPAGAVRGSQNQDEPSEGEDHETEGADAAPPCTQGTNAGDAGPTDITDRS